MATKKASSNGKSKGKSTRGGRRAGAGRKPLPVSKLRAEIIAEVDKEICHNLPQLIKNMLYLANGGYERVEEKWAPSDVSVAIVPKGEAPPPPELILSERKVSIAEPDRAANEYLINRVLGKPTERKEVSGLEGGPVQLDVRSMTDEQLHAILETEGGSGT